MFFSFSVINSYFCTCHFRMIVFLYIFKIEIISPEFTIYIISLLNQSVCQHIHICSICIYLTDFYFSSLSFFIPFFIPFSFFFFLSFFLSFLLSFFLSFFIPFYLSFSLSLIPYLLPLLLLDLYWAVSAYGSYSLSCQNLR